MDEKNQEGQEATKPEVTSEAGGVITPTDGVIGEVKTAESDGTQTASSGATSSVHATTDSGAGDADKNRDEHYDASKEPTSAEHSKVGLRVRLKPECHGRCKLTGRWKMNSSWWVIQGYQGDLAVVRDGEAERKLPIADVIINDTGVVIAGYANGEYEVQIGVVRHRVKATEAEEVKS